MSPSICACTTAVGAYKSKWLSKFKFGTCVAHSKLSAILRSKGQRSRSPGLKAHMRHSLSYCSVLVAMMEPRTTVHVPATCTSTGSKPQRSRSRSRSRGRNVICAVRALNTVRCNHTNSGFNEYVSLIQCNDRQLSFDFLSSSGYEE